MEHIKFITIRFDVLKRSVLKHRYSYAKEYIKIEFLWPLFCFKKDNTTSYCPLNGLWKRDPAFYFYSNCLSGYWSRQFQVHNR